MKTYNDCIPCFMQQALRVCRLSIDNEEHIRTILIDVADMLKDFSNNSAPPEIAFGIYKKIEKLTGVDNPYKNVKEENIKEALSLYPELKQIVQKSNNRLLTAIRIAIAGNVIDLGINKNFNIVDELNQIFERDFAIFDFRKFTEQLANAKSILYLGDNAGESVFDKILIEELNKPVTYIVRESPIINDVTIQDAISSELDEVAEIMSSGCPAPGIILSLCNKEFLSLYNEAEMIISKGQGNYEGLSDCKRPIFFLLKAKCPVIANDLNVKESDIVLKASDYV